MSILCPSCHGALPSWLIRSNRTDTFCSSCYAALKVEVFPAFLRSPDVIVSDSLNLNDGEACCYEHATKRAVQVCGRCGRFVCALCEVEMQGEVWCPACLPLDKPQAAVQTLETQRTLYDSIALALATWPLLTFYFAFLVSPAVIYVVVRYWKRPSSLIPRSKWRFIAASIIAGGELVLLALAIVTLTLYLKGRRP